MIQIFILLLLSIIILVDVFYLGFFCTLLGLFPKFEGYILNEKIVIKEKMISGFTFDKEAWIMNKREYYSHSLSVILTDQRILIKPQLLSCLLSLKFNKINKFEEKRAFLKQFICLYYKEGGVEKNFCFRPKQYDLWLTKLREKCPYANGLTENLRKKR